MADPETAVESLDAEVTALSNKIERIEADFADLQSRQEDVQSTTQAFVENLGPTWAQLVQRLADLDSYVALQDAIEDTEDFLAELHRVVLHPRRARLERGFDEWLATWSAVEIPWDEFLEEAKDEELSELENWLDSREVPELDDSGLAAVWRGWVDHQAQELNDKEKRFETLRSWLTHFAKNEAEALGLDQFLTSTAEGDDAHPVIDTIEHKWLNDLRQRVAALQARQHDLGLAAQLEDAKSSWEEVHRVMAPLRASLQGLSTDEISLIDGFVDSWDEVTASEIQSLIEDLATVAAQKRRLLETQQLSLNGASLADPALGIVQDLVETRPRTPDAARSGSLPAYQDELERATERLDVWMTEFGAAEAFLRRQTAILTERASAYDLDDQLEQLHEMVSNIVSLRDLVDTHNRLIEIRDEIYHLRREELTEEEKEALAELLRYSGREGVSLADLTQQLETQARDSLALVASLVDKDFIQVDVVVR